MKLLSIWGHVKRPWGYEIRADFIDDKNRIYNEVLIFRVKPSSEELAEQIQAAQDRLEITPTIIPGEMDDISVLRSKVEMLTAEKAALEEQLRAKAKVLHA